MNNKLQNCIQQTEQLHMRMERELDAYRKLPKHNSLHADIMQRRINLIAELLDQFIGLGFDADESQKENLATISAFIKTMEKLESLEFRLEACLIFHGITEFEIRRWKRMSDKQAVDEVKRVLAEKRRQIPAMIDYGGVDSEPDKVRSFSITGNKAAVTQLLNIKKMS